MYKSLFKSATELVTEIINGTDQSIIVGQRATVIVKGWAWCNIKLSNSAVVDVAAISHLDGELESAVMNELINNIKRDITKAIEQKVGLGGGGVNVGEEVTRLMTTIETQLKASVMSSIRNTIKQTTSASQVAELVVTGWIWGSRCDVSNSAVVKMTAENVTDATVKFLQDNKAFNEMLNKFDLSMKQTSDILGGLLLILLAVLVLLPLVAFGAYKVFTKVNPLARVVGTK
jgi:hypothetical protein